MDWIPAERIDPSGWVEIGVVEVISLAVRWYLRYGLSYRDVEELLAERRLMVDHVTVYRWEVTILAIDGVVAAAHTATS